MLPTVFLSYARADDEPFVKKLHESLTVQGFRVWWDRVSMPNRALTFLQEIRDAIGSADCLVLVVGPGAMRSDYVRTEWQHALEYCKPVHPVLRVGDYGLLPPDLALLDTPDFRDDDQYEQSLEHLLRHLNEPVTPLGKLVAVPELPPHFLPRPGDLEALKQPVLADVQKPVVVTGTARRVGLHGMGGIGKSVQAAALAQDCEVRRAFPDGVLWVTIGQLPNLPSRQYDLCFSLGSPPPYPFIDVNAGKAHLSAVLADKRCLLILDDIWQVEHAQAFDALGPRCRMLLTTRDAELITALGAHEHRLEVLAEDDALSLMAGWLMPEGISAPEQSERKEQLRAELPAAAREVAHECGYLPLALALSAAQVRDGTPWGDLLDALREADLEFFDHPHGSILKSLKVSVDALQQTNPDYARHYLELAVFPEDTPVPEAAILTLWLHTNGINERRARQLLRVLASKALIRAEGAQPNSQIELHDLQHLYLRQALGNLDVAHEELLTAYRMKCSDGWHTGPNDGYFFAHLAYHLNTARRNDDLRALFADQDWLRVRFEHDGYNYSGYIQDLMIAWEHVAHAEALRQIEAGEEPAAIADCVRDALIRASINSLAGNYVPELAVRAVETGLWTTQRALSVAAQVPDAVRQVKMCVALLATGKLTPEQEHNAQTNAWDAVQAMQNESNRVQSLAVLVDWLTSAQVQQALDTALASRYENIRGRTLTILADRLTDAQVQQALDASLAIGAPEVRARALAKLADRLQGEQRWRTVQQALDIARIIEYVNVRAKVLVELADRVDGVQVQQALDVVLGMGYGPYLAEALAAMVPKLTPAQISQVLNAALSIPNELEQARAVVALASCLTGNQRRQAVQRVLNTVCSAKNNRGQALMVLADQLEGTQVKQAWDAALTTPNEQSRAEVLAALAGRLEDRLRSQAIQQAWSAALAVSYEMTRAEILVSLADRLEGESRRQAIQQALDAALTYQNEAYQQRAIEIVVDHLEGPQVQQALDAALGIRSQANREPILAKLANRLTSVQVQQALATARFIQAGSEVRTVTSLLDQLQGELHQRALQQVRDVALAMRDPNTRSRILMSLIDQVEGEVQEQVLQETWDAALAIQHPQDRANTLTRLVDHFEGEPRSQIARQALDAVQEIRDGEAPFRALQSLANRLTDEQVQRALDISLANREPHERADIVAKLADRFTDEQVQQVLDFALIQDMSGYSICLFWPALVGRLDSTQLQSTLDFALAIESPTTRARTLMSLFDQLHGESRHRAIHHAWDAALAIPHHGDTRNIETRISVLIAVANRLEGAAGQQAVEQALGTILAIPHDVNRANALVQLLEQLESELCQAMILRVQQAILAIRDTRARAQALTNLANQLEGKPRQQVIQQALGAALAIENEDYRVSALIPLLDRLNSVQIQRALDAALTIQDEKHRGRMLTAMVGRLAGAQIQQVLNAALTIQDEAQRAQVLVAFLPICSNTMILMAPIRQAITLHLISSRHQERRKVLSFLSSKNLFAPPVISQDTLAHIVEHVIEVCYQWSWL